MASIGRNELEIEDDPIAAGGFGAVYRGIWKTKGNQPVAIKKLLTVDFREVETLKRLQHLNIVSFFGYVKEKTDVMIVMELCELGSLKSYLDARMEKPLSLDLTYDWLLHAALPIQYLRKHNIEHMDIKTDNYVITGKMVLKLTDFGLSVELESTQSFSSEAGSWRWMPPERLRDHKLSPKFDIWALALVYWCLFTRQLPYSNYESNFGIAQAVINGERPAIPSTCPEPVANLISSCWEDDRSKRPDIEHVIAAIVHSKSAFRVESKTSEKATQTKASAFTQAFAATGHDIPIRKKYTASVTSTVKSDSGVSKTSNGSKLTLPSNWIPMNPGQNSLAVTPLQTSKEYTAIEGNFQQSIGPDVAVIEEMIYESEVWGDLDQKKMDRIFTIAQHNSVKIYPILSGRAKRILIEGRTVDVKSTRAEIQKYLTDIQLEKNREFENCLINKEIQWRYEDNTGQLVGYGDDVNPLIERAYRAKKTHIDLDLEEGKIRIDLQTMKERDLARRLDIDIQRIDLKKGSKLTSNWIPMNPGQNSMAVTPLQTSREYTAIEGNFQQSIGRNVAVIEEMVYESEVWGDLDQKKMDRIFSIARHNSVKIDPILSGRAKRILIEGRTVDVKSTRAEILKYFTDIQLEKKRELENCLINKEVQWCYEDNTGQLLGYGDDINPLIERAYRARKTHIDLDLEEGKIRIDLQTKKERDLAGRNVDVDIQRIDLKKASKFTLPSYWIPMNPGQNSLSVKLLQTSREYTEIEGVFKQSIGRNVAVIEIQRIQNEELFKQYTAKKERMLVSGKRGVQVERQVYHGTAQQNCDKISAHGFNRSFHGANGTLLGKGLYFARDASYSNGYAKPSGPNNYQHVFYCKVLTGEYTIGNQSIVAPPAKPGNPSDLYDSVVDRHPNPAVFVVFHDDQALPEYLIIFQ